MAWNVVRNQSSGKRCYEAFGHHCSCREGASLRPNHTYGTIPVIPPAALLFRQASSVPLYAASPEKKFRKDRAAVPMVKPTAAPCGEEVRRRLIPAVNTPVRICCPFGTGDGVLACAALASALHCAMCASTSWGVWGFVGSKLLGASLKKDSRRQ